MTIEEQISRAAYDARNAKEALERAEEAADEAVENLRALQAAAEGKRVVRATIDETVLKIRAWLAHEILVGLSKPEVALVERLIDDIDALPVRRAA